MSLPSILEIISAVCDSDIYFENSQFLCELILTEIIESLHFYFLLTIKKSTLDAISKNYDSLSVALFKI